MPDFSDAFGDNIELIGYLRKDEFGRLFIDSCATDEEHLTLPLVVGQERRSCRKYLVSYIPDEMLNQKVFISMDIGIKKVKV